MATPRQIVTALALAASCLVVSNSMTAVAQTPPPSDLAAQRPPSPRDVTARNNLDGSVTISWTRLGAPDSVERYDVYRNGVLTTEFDGDATEADIAVDAVGFFHGTNHLQLVAVDELENASVRSTPTVVVLDRVRPSTPSNVSVEYVPDDIEKDRYRGWRVSFDSVDDRSGIAAYAVLVNGRVEQTVRGLEPLDDSERIEMYAEIDPGPNWVQVIAIDGSGNTSRRTSPVRVDGLDRLAPPRAENIVAVPDGNDAVVLSWDPGEGNAPVRTHTIDTVKGQFAGPGPSTRSTEFATEWNPRRPGEHTLQIRTVGENGWTARSATFVVDVANNASGRPFRPSLVRAFTEPRKVDGALTTVASLDWLPVTDADGDPVSAYEVYANDELLGTTPIPFGIYSLQPGTYGFRVVAVDADGNRSRSSLITTETIAELPAARTPQIFASVDGDDVTFHFTLPDEFPRSVEPAGLLFDTGGSLTQILSLDTVPTPIVLQNRRVQRPFAATIEVEDLQPGTYTYEYRQASDRAGPPRSVSFTVR